MLALIVGAAFAQTPPCDEPPKEEVVKCEGEKAANPNRKIDLSALLGAPAPKADPGCRRTRLTVLSGRAGGVEDRLATADAQLVRCGSEARVRTPSLSGTARIELTVDAEGKVSSVETPSSTLTDPELATCFEQVLARATFGPGARVMQIEIGCQ